MGILDVGITGLRVAQLALQTTSHNIANASTSGYNRQEAMQTSNQPNLTGYGYFGQGAQVSTVRRVYSEFLGSQILGAEANVGELDMYLVQAQQIDNLVADPNAGLSPALSSFFQSVQQMAADPSSIPARQSMLSSGQAMVSRFQALDQRMGEIRDGVNTQLINETNTINAYANQLAELNDRIVQATAISQGNPPNDLLDQRDEMVRSLNKEIRVSTIGQSDGSLNVFIGSGQPLVVGVTSYQLAADTASNEDPERITVRLISPSGIGINVPEGLLQGGALGGMLRFRSEMLDPAQNALGKVAMAISMNFNAQHRMGIDLQGSPGLDFFTPPQPVVLSNAANTGNAELSAKIIQSDYKLDIGAATITRLSDGVVTAFSGFPQSIDGITISNLSGTPGPADVFIIKPGAGSGQRVIAASDNAATGVKLDSTASNLQTLPSVSSDYRLTIGAGGQLQLVRQSDNKTWSATNMSNLQRQLDEDPQGFSLSWTSGTPRVGDTFLIEPTRQTIRNMSLAIADSLKIAAAAPFRTSAALANKGTGKIDMGSVITLDPAVLDIKGKVLSSPLTVTYDQLNGQLNVDNGVLTRSLAFVPGQPNVYTLDGLRFTISGVPSDGDVFTLERNLNGVSDNRNATALGALQLTNVLNGGASTFQSAYGQIVSYAGNKTREVEVTGMAQQTLADQAETSRQSLSGVNLDEEAANLMRFQQAYQASAKVMNIAGKLFDELLALGR